MWSGCGNVTTIPAPSGRAFAIAALSCFGVPLPLTALSCRLRSLVGHCSSPARLSAHGGSIARGAGYPGNSSSQAAIRAKLALGAASHDRAIPTTRPDTPAAPRVPANALPAVRRRVHRGSRGDPDLRDVRAEHAGTWSDADMIVRTNSCTRPSAATLPIGPQCPVGLSIASLQARSPSDCNGFRQRVAATFIQPNPHAAEYGEFDWIRAKAVPSVAVPSTEDGDSSCQMIRRSLGKNFDRAST